MKAAAAVRPARDLIRRHAYPEELAEVLVGLAEAAQRAYPALVSLVLTGSTATGDFVWRRTEDGVELLSDLDVLLFAEGKGSRPELLHGCAHAFEERFASPLFRVDVAHNPAGALGRIAPTYQMAEARRAGVILAGENVLDRFPESFDPRASRQAFLANLWKPALAWRCEGLSTDLAYQQSAARLFLDLPLLAASERGLCIPGHGARVAWFQSEGSASSLHSPGISDAVDWALQARRHPGGADEGLARRVSEVVFEACGALDGCGTPPADPDRALVRRLSAWLPPRTARRFAGELRTALGAPRGLADLGWWIRRKEARAGAALLGLLAYQAGGLAGPPPPGIAARLAEFARRAPPAGKGEGFLIECRRIYWAGLRELYPSMAAKDEEMQKRLCPETPD